MDIGYQREAIKMGIQKCKNCETKFKYKDYNPFSDGLDIRIFMDFGLWIIIYTIICFVLNQFIFKKR